MIVTRILSKRPANSRVVPYLSHCFSICLLLMISDFSDAGASIGRPVTLIHVRYLAQLGRCLSVHNIRDLRI